MLPSSITASVVQVIGLHAVHTVIKAHNTVFLRPHSYNDMMNGVYQPMSCNAGNRMCSSGTRRCQDTEDSLEIPIL